MRIDLSRLPTINLKVTHATTNIKIKKLAFPTSNPYPKKDLMKCILIKEEMMIDITIKTLDLQIDFGGRATVRLFIMLYAKNTAEARVPIEIIKVLIRSRETNLLQKNDRGAKIIVTKKT